MLNHEHVGKVLLEMYDKVKVEKIGITSNGKEWYFINDKYPDEVTNGLYQLWDQQYMDYILQRQEEYKNKLEIHNIKVAEQEKREQEETRIQAEKENLYGFDDEKTPMQKGKILKTLMKKYHYKSNNIDIGHMTRKDFIIRMLQENYTIEHLTNLKYWKKDGFKIKENEYRFVAQDKSFYEITKTEFDFAKYLIDNKIVEVEKVI